MSERHPFATRKGAAFRLAILNRDHWLCQMCGCLLTEGRTHPRAAVVDHLIPVALRPDLAYDPANCRAVCKADHDGACQSIERRHWPDAEVIARAKRLTKGDGAIWTC
jgi:5-methylcytosine-specific restriction endonuclease McrA